MLSEVADKILAFDTILILSHTNPDPDAFGSSCGLMLGLKTLGKTVSVFNERGAVERYLNIPGVKYVSESLPVLTGQELIIVCDCGDIKRVGDTFVQWLQSAKNTISIDHHTSNTLFAELNWVDEKASSTSEIIFRLLRELELRSGKTLVTLDVARALLTGIIADTGSFRYQSTSDTTFEAAAFLYQRGATPNFVATQVFSKPKLAVVKMLGDLISRVSLKFDGQFAEVVASEELVKSFGAVVEDTDPLVERARDIEGVKISSLYKQDSGLWRVSLRSVGPEYDVSEVARSFGGGGHKAAAAFRSKLDIEQLRVELTAKISEVFSNFKG